MLHRNQAGIGLRKAVELLKTMAETDMFMAKNGMDVFCNSW